MYVCEAHPYCCYLTSVESHWRECVAAAKKLGKRESVWKRSIYRKYASWRWLQTQDENLRADVVLSVSRGSPPRLNMCASAIFVVRTTGIPPILNYRSVKSYNIPIGNLMTLGIIWKINLSTIRFWIVYLLIKFRILSD